MRLGLSGSTLNKWRCRPGGPEYLKQGGRCVRYEEAVVDAWKASRRRLGTWQYRQPTGSGGRENPLQTQETPDKPGGNGRIASGRPHPRKPRAERPKRP